MAKIKNYADLTDKMLNLFNKIENDEVSIDKAIALVRTSDSIVKIQKAKIMSTKVTGDKQIKFFKD